MLQQLFRFQGGIEPAYHKQESVREPIAQAPLPPRLIIPLHQSIGGTPRPVVAVGDKVLKGQLIGAADGWISAAVHASTSGTVVEIGPRRIPHPSGLTTDCVVIEPDGEARWIERAPLDYRAMAPEEVRAYLQNAGIVGLGGAAFPSHAKLTTAKGVPMQELVINGAECEPWITCDDMLMRERAAEIVAGIGLFRDLLQPQRVLIGIEDNKPEAIAAMTAAVRAAGESFEVIAVPTRYPAGGAKQLIRVLTGKEIPAAKRSTDLGVQCFNVATAYSAWRAVAHGEPLISRIVTLTGNADRPRNWEVPIGMPIDALLPLAAPRPDTDGVIMGGPMMGFLIPALDVPVIKATNCLIAHSPSLFPPQPPEMPCIRCGECARACPHELQPMDMYWWSRAKNFGKAQEAHLFDCIECGCCAYVCPAHIPLVQYFRFAKSEIWAREKERKLAEGAKERFEFKQFREEREKAEKAEKLAKAAAAQAAKKAAEAAAASAAGSTAPPTDAAEAAKKAAIAAALERARAQRAAVQARNTEDLPPEKAREIAAIDARRQQAGLEPAAATPLGKEDA
ncbi:MAG: electron transport complex subunit RsxC [Azovibrio sp.]|nr:electron transport complex subunit RsxC [Azovibrio sp.]